MKTIRWYVAIFALAFGATAGFLANAAPGDLIVQKQFNKAITGQQAGCFATCAINAGVADIVAADMVSACAWRDPYSTTGFSAKVTGLKAYAPNALPIGDDPVPVVGVVQ